MAIISDITSGALRTAENAAIACYEWIGRGKEKLADAAAVDSMRNSLNQMPISGTIVIGEGERDEGGEGDEKSCRIRRTAAPPRLANYRSRRVFPAIVLR